MTTATKNPTNLEINTSINQYATLMNIEVSHVSGLVDIKWSNKLKKGDLNKVLTKMKAIYKGRKVLIDKIVRYEGGEADITMTRKELRELLAQLETSTTEEEESVTKPSSNTFTQEQLQQIIDRATSQAVQEAVASESAKYEAKIEQLLQQNALLASQLSENPEPKKEEPKKEDKLEVDVSVVYDSLQAEAQKLLNEASDAIKEKNFDLYNKLMKDYGKVNSKAYDLGEQHKDKIFTVERSKKVMDDTRASIAKGLHNSAEVTNKYGHKGVDSLVSLANDILNGAVVVAKTGIDLTGKVGHTGVDLASDTLHAAGEFVEKK